MSRRAAVDDRRLHTVAGEHVGCLDRPVYADPDADHGQVAASLRVAASPIDT